MRVLAENVEPAAAESAHDSGVGTPVPVPLGGFHDPERFRPMQVTATVELLSRGQARLETMGIALDAGPTAVLPYGHTTVVVMSRSVRRVDRAMYYANGLEPRNFDLTKTGRAQVYTPVHNAHLVSRLRLEKKK